MKTLRTFTGIIFTLAAFSCFLTPTQAQTPDSIAGMVLQITVTSASGSFNTGSGVLSYYNNGTYSLAFDGNANSGTYSYYKSSASAGVINMIESEGFSQVVSITFSSFAGGTFLVTSPASPGSYGSGTFVVTVRTLPGDVALLSPIDGASLTERQPQFYWSQTTPASTWYHVYLQRNGAKCLDQWIQGTTWTPASTLGGGSYTWWVQGWNSAGSGPWSQGSDFTLPSATPGTLTPVSPAQVSVTNATIRYTWTADTNAAWYQLCIMKGSSVVQNKWYAGSSSVIDTGSGNFAVDVAGHSMGTYSWWVRGWSADGMGPWSSNCTFTVADLKPGVVNLLSPAAAQNNTSLVRFTWEVEPKAAWYEFCLMKNGKVITDKWCSATDSVIDISTGQFGMDMAGHAGGSYQWWVRAWSPDGMGPWSAAMSYTVTVQAPGAGTLVAPTGTTTDNTPTFQWDALEEAVWYCIWIQKGSSKYYSTWVNTNSWTPSWPMQAGNYQWWVQGWNEDGLGDWSSSLSFTISGQ